MQQRRIRPTLLVLLWIWAGCVFLVLDLFLNVERFDAIRPRAPLYRRMRCVAHEMVGEPIREPPAPPPRRPPGRLPGDDAAERRAAIRAAACGGSQACQHLLACCRDTGEEDRVRAEAARLLGRVGGLPCLEGLLASELPARVRRGAVLGLAEVGTEDALRRALGLACAARDRPAALEALGRMHAAGTAALMSEVARDPRWEPDVRAAACRALARPGATGNVPPLCRLLDDPEAPVVARREAALALGTIGDRTAMPALASACVDAQSDVSRAARAAHRMLARSARGR